MDARYFLCAYHCQRTAARWWGDNCYTKLLVIRQYNQLGKTLFGREGDFIVAKDGADLHRMQEWFVDYLERNPTPAMYSFPIGLMLWPVKMANISRKIRSQQHSTGTVRCVPGKVMWSGAFNSKDQAVLGYSRHQPVFVKVTEGTCRAYLVNSADLSTVSYVRKSEHDAERVNLLYWHNRKNWQYYDRNEGS